MRTHSTLAIVLTLLAVGLSGCADNGPGPAVTPRPLASCTVPQAMSEPLAAVLAAYGAAPRVEVVTNRGSFVVTVHAAQVPITAMNFLDLASQGFYEDVKFHRVIDRFMIQGGDPNTKNDAARPTWGSGGPGYSIVDEFHPDLRHQGEGILSMANSGPNTGGSQFFVTLGDTAHLDLRHTVFGRVTAGMDVVRAIGQTPTTGSPNDPPENRPVDPVVIERMEVHADASAPEPAAPRLSAVRTVQAAPAGGTATFLVLADAAGEPLPNASLSVRTAGDAPSDVTVESEDCFADFGLPARQRLGILVAAHLPTGLAVGTQVPLEAVLGAGDHEVTLALTAEVAPPPQGTPAASGSAVSVDYAGLLINGFLFDTSLHAVAEDDRLQKHPLIFRPRPAGDYSPIEFEVDGGVIEGFSEAVRGLYPGQSSWVRIPPEQAYGPTGHSLSGRTLIFLVDLKSVA